ncbi:MAG: SpoVA/SpoVAEb family sporulation membrane protein [Clostridia bacterium]|nr:SpoVA/SpoVAEb family sporulation membrane protein [Clostridia bacterium]
MHLDKKEYEQYVAAHAKKSPLLRDSIRAFLVGGGICALAEGLRRLYEWGGLPHEDASAFCSITLVFVAVLLTAIGIFDKIARFAGAGTLVPITGFANAVASPAIDSRAEGIVLGIGAKIFTVAGPVLLYGTLAGTVYGVIYYVTG